MFVSHDGSTIEIKDGEAITVGGLELVGNKYDAVKAQSLNQGSWNEKNIKNFLYLLSLVNSAYTKTQTDEAIDDRINFLIGSAPQNLDTIYEIAMKLNENDGALSQLLDLISQKADKPLPLDFASFGFSTNISTGLSVGSKLPIFSSLSSANTLPNKTLDTVTLKANKTYKLSAQIGAASFSSSNSEFMALFRTSSGIDVSTSVYILPQSFSADSRFRNSMAFGLVRFPVDTDINFVVSYNSGLNALYAGYSYAFIEEIRG